MIIVTSILAVSIIIIVFLFIQHITHLNKEFRVREWELQERIREPMVEIMPPPMVKAEADIKRDMADKVEQMSFEEDPDDAEMSLVGEIFPDGVSGREDN